MGKHALAITTIHRRNENAKGGVEVIPASTKEKVSVFETTAEEFGELEKLGAVREASKDEIAIFKASASSTGNESPSDVKTTLVGGDSTSQASQPDTGAANDPNGKPKGAKAARKPKKDSTTGADSEDDESQDDESDLGV